MFKVKPKRRQWRRFGVFIVNVEHISHLVLMFLFLTFEQVNAGWVRVLKKSNLIIVEGGFTFVIEIEKSDTAVFQDSFS